MKILSLLLFFFACAQSLMAGEAGLLEQPPEPGHELLGSIWQVEDILGEPVIEGSRTEFSFFEPGRIAATVGCNRMAGGVIKGNGTLKFGMMMMTRMACEEGLMEQEERFAQALAEVTQYRLEEDGAVLLFLDGGEQILVRLIKFSVSNVLPE